MGQDKKISELSVADKLSGSEKFVFAKNGDNGAVTANTIKTFTQNGVVKEVTGKGLSTNDYTNEDKAKLDTLSPKEALFIDLWDNACGDYGTYNAETGYFELNGLTDITYEEAITIYNLYDGGRNGYIRNRYSFMDNIRTLLPIKLWRDLDVVSIYAAFYNSSFVAIRFAYCPYANIGELTHAFSNCQKLKNIYGIISVVNAKANALSGFNMCTALESVQIKGLKFSIVFANSPLLSLESFQYMITNAANTAPITITVHPDVYAKLTGDTANQAAAELTPEEAAQWQQLVTDAAAKQITFVTA